MRIIDYIRGKRRGAEANRLEKESMTDPFLFDAIEGYDSIQDDHYLQIMKLQSRIASKKGENNRFKLHYWKLLAVASVAVILIFTTYFIIEDRSKSHLYALTEVSTSYYSPYIDIYVPEEFYTENETTIEMKNELLTEENVTISSSATASGHLGRSINMNGGSGEVETKAKLEDTYSNDTIYIYVPSSYTSGSY